MLRILQSVNIMDRAGLENMLMNYYRNIDRNRIQFDFLTHRPDIGAYEEEIISMGGKVYHAPRLYPQNYPSYFFYMAGFFREHPEYQIVHSHIDAMSSFPLAAAKISRVPVRIAHSHSTKLDKDLKLPIKFAALKLLPGIANQYCACGKQAGKFMFGNREFKIINNAVDLDRFSFNEEVRIQTRQKLGLHDELVIGHVGRFCYIKNQLFLLDVLKDILIKVPNARLMLVGNGEDKEKLVEKAKALGLEDAVILLVDRDDVADLYQAMDIFVMPSLFEGLPMVGVEAQASGLSCLFSDRISSEVLLSDSAHLFTLDKTAADWAEEILSVDKNRKRSAKEQLREKGYDIKNEAEKLCAWYESFGACV